MIRSLTVATLILAGALARFTHGAAATRPAPESKPQDVRDLFKGSYRNGEISVQWVGPVVEGQQTINVAGGRATVRIHNQGDDDHRQVITVIWTGLAAQGNAMRLVHATFAGKDLSMIIQPSRANVGTVIYSQSPERAGLIVSRGREQIRLEGKKLGELIQKDRELVTTTVIPALAILGITISDVPKAADVYRVLNEIAPDPAASRKVQEILPRLDAEKASERDAASADLAKLGPAGVLAVLRVDRNSLSAEQAARIDAFLGAQGDRVPSDQVETVAKDRQFLIDCLLYDDLTVRQTAKARLEKLLAKQVEFDPAAGAEDRSIAVEKLRHSLSPATRPGE